MTGNSGDIITAQSETRQHGLVDGFGMARQTTHSMNGLSLCLTALSAALLPMAIALFGRKTLSISDYEANRPPFLYCVLPQSAQVPFKSSSVGFKAPSCALHLGSIVYNIPSAGSLDFAVTGKGMFWSS
jgi:hypothetical protein